MGPKDFLATNISEILNMHFLMKTRLWTSKIVRSLHSHGGISPSALKCIPVRGVCRIFYPRETRTKIVELFLQDDIKPTPLLFK